MTVEHFLLRLSGVVRLRNGTAKARCPSHDDHTPSLSITPGAHVILLHCWAGCTVGAIVAALTLTLADLRFGTPTPRERRAAIARRTRRDRALDLRGQQADALKASEQYLVSQRGLDPGTFTAQDLAARLDRLADAYHLLFTEEHGDHGHSSADR